jgi:hypothetical protein
VMQDLKQVELRLDPGGQTGEKSRYDVAPHTPERIGSDDVLAERMDLSVAPVRLLIMSPGDATALIDSMNWTFAKTMTFVPHWYVIRDRDVRAEQFESLVRYLRANGRIGLSRSESRR